MAAIRRPFNKQARAETLLVFLPGVKDRAGAFQEHGFVDAVRRRQLPIDVVEADAHSGYYVDGTLDRRLHFDIIEPARRRGYRHVVLVGVSMGAYGALRYAMTYPHEISTIVLIAPFLGAGPFDRRLAEAGDDDFSLTRDFINRYPEAADPPSRAATGYPRLVLGYGKDDIFAKSDGEIAAHLPPSDVVTVGGAHVWGTWLTLFDELLDRHLVVP
jgi:pimeloyl-ACP methyl ester carboxylesterase